MTWVSATLLETERPPAKTWVNLARVDWMRRFTNEQGEAYTMLYFGSEPGIRVAEAPEELLHKLGAASSES